MKSSTARAARPNDFETELTLEEASAARAHAETARRAATAAVEAAVNRWPAPNNQRSFVRGLHMRPAANDYSMSEVARDTYTRLEAFKAAEEIEGQADRALELAIAAEARAIKLAFGDGRGALAEAIAAARVRAAEADTARATAERARGTMAKARMVLDQADVDLADAREAAIGAATAADGVQPIGLKDLRRTAADALDDFDIASEAVRRAEAATEEPIAAETAAHGRVEAAARAVLYADFDERLSALDAMVFDFRCRAITRAAWLMASVPSSGAWTTEKANHYRHAERRLTGLTELGEPIRSSTYPAGDHLFAGTLAALQLDATAPIPEMP